MQVSQNLHINYCFFMVSEPLIDTRLFFQWLHLPLLPPLTNQTALPLLLLSLQIFHTLLLSNSLKIIICFGKLKSFLTWKAKRYLAMLMALFWCHLKRFLLLVMVPLPSPTPLSCTGSNKTRCYLVLSFLPSSKIWLLKLLFTSPPVEVWLALERLFSSHSRARIMQIHFQLATLKKGGSSISDYYQKFKSLSDGLVAAGQSLNDYESFFVSSFWTQHWLSFCGGLPLYSWWYHANWRSLFSFAHPWAMFGASFLHHWASFSFGQSCS